MRPVALPRLLLAVASWLVAQPTRAQSTPSMATVPTMTFAEALAYARAHQPQMASAAAQLAAARAEGDEPRAQWLPMLGATAQIYAATSNNTSAVYLAGRDVDVPRVGGTAAVGRVASASWSPYASTLAAVGVRQEVFDFGRIAAQTAAADAQVQIAQARTGVAWLTVRYGVEEAFEAVFAARAVQTAADEAYDRAVVHRDLAAAWVAQGLRSRIELARAEADRARYEAARMRARGGLESAQSVLAAAVGFAAPRLDAAGALPPTTSLPSLETALDDAARRDPRLIEAVARLRAQQARTRSIAAEMRPNVSATASISGRAGGAPVTAGSIEGAGLAPIVPDWDVGLVLDWPLFDATVLARANTSRRREDAARADVTATREIELAAIEQAWIVATTAMRQQDALLRAVEGARANYEQADARFRQGLGSSVELADAAALRADAEIQFALGRFEIARTRALFARATAEGL